MKPNDFQKRKIFGNIIIRMESKNSLEKHIRFNRKLAVCLSIIAIVICISSFTAWAYYSPYSYVSLDVNPSIEFTINVFDRVLSVNAVNEDGKSILEGLSLENKNINEAVELTIKVIASQGYINKNEDEIGGVVITTSSESGNKSDELANELKGNAERILLEQNREVIIETASVGLDRVEEAKALGVTPGKLNLVQKLQASLPESVLDENFDSKEWIEVWLDKPVKEIMKEIKKNKKASKEASKVDKAETDEANNSIDTDVTDTTGNTDKTGNDNDAANGSENTSDLSTGQVKKNSGNKTSSNNGNGNGNGNSKDNDNATKNANKNFNKNSNKNSAANPGKNGQSNKDN